MFVQPRKRRQLAALCGIVVVVMSAMLIWLWSMTDGGATWSGSSSASVVYDEQGGYSLASDSDFGRKVGEITLKYTFERRGFLFPLIESRFYEIRSSAGNLSGGDLNKILGAFISKRFADTALFYSARRGFYFDTASRHKAPPLSSEILTGGSHSVILWGGLALLGSWLVVVVLTLIFLLIMVRQLVLSKRVVLGHCRSCGYELGVAHSRRCPECGTWQSCEDGDEVIRACE